VTKQSTNLQQVLRLLPQLKPAELTEVRNRLQFLGTPDETPGTDDWLTEGIVSELVRRGLLRKQQDGFWRRSAPKGYSANAEVQREFLIDASRKDLPGRVCLPLSIQEKYALGRVVGRALADYLANTPGFGLKVMLQNINKIPEALDASFPGYVAAGRLSLLIKVKS
jgi:hypothetical protein